MRHGVDFFNPQISNIECSDEALLYKYRVDIFNPWSPPGILDFKYLTLNAQRSHYYTLLYQYSVDIF